MKMDIVKMQGPTRLRTQFLATHHERHERLEQLMSDIRQDQNRAAGLAEARATLHRLARVAGSLGFSRLGTMAGSLEKTISSHITAGTPDNNTLIRGMDRFLDLSMDLSLPEA